MNIGDWRKKIDELDLKLVDLLSQRADAAKAIGLLKRDANTPIHEPNREQQVLANIARANRGPLSDHDLRLIFETIFDVMRKLQAKKS